MSDTERIKERLSIEDVVSSYIKLERAGKNLKAKCPFHNEKTPSFYVSPERDSYYCFGCGAGGDIFTFVEEFEGLDFRGALKVLAQRAGVTLLRKSKGVQDKTDRLYAVLEEGSQWFQDNLAKSTDVTKYVAERNIKDTTRDTFRLGYAPPKWRALSEYLRKKGYTDEELFAVGLIKKADNKRPYDVFRDRLIFPITDSAGRVIAFSGRTVHDDVDAPKYLNTPETTLFKKGKTLYGYTQAKTAMRKHNFAIVVEGQTDVLLSHQAGFANTIAPLGTALTLEHLQLLKRFTNNLVLALDADAAGMSSVSRDIVLDRAEGGTVEPMNIKVAVLPEGNDPADVISQDVEEWKRAIREAVPIVDFWIMAAQRKAGDDKGKFYRVLQEEVFPNAALLISETERAEFQQKVADAMGVPTVTLAPLILEGMKRAARESRTTRGREDVVGESGGKRKTVLERKDAALRHLSGLILWQKSVKDERFDVEKAIARACSLTGRKDLDELIDVHNRDELIFEAESLFGQEDDLEKHIEEILYVLEEEKLRGELAQTMQRLKKAENSHNTSKAKTLLEQCQNISKRIEALRHATA